MAPTWLTVFLDLPAEGFESEVAFWEQVTGHERSALRGDDELTTLVPPAGDGYIRVRRLSAGMPGVHLDLHAPDHVVEERRSPGGLRHSLVPGAEAARPGPASWPDGHRSMVDQVCIDIPPEVYDEECAYWSDLTGWELVDVGHSEFRRLRTPPGQPLAILLQRLDSGEGPVRAHLDLSTDDRGTETRRHERLGARVVRVHEEWTVMRPPAGPVYCITDRVPRA
ncbi:MAG TPA: VOC family protein [Marmoricola sp.]|nr:VOC family protein [Marmoricola sp.]